MSGSGKRFGQVTGREDRTYTAKASVVFIRQCMKLTSKVVTGHLSGSGLPEPQWEGVREPTARLVNGMYT